MFVGIGFLIASLLVVGVIPLVHGRAVRLTTRRLEAVTPMSMAEIQADKDQLRAEFAMSTRRLEMSVEQMKAKTTTQLAELGKKSEAVGRLKLELTEKTSALRTVEARDQQLSSDLERLQDELLQKTDTLILTQEKLSDTEVELARITSNLQLVSESGDNQRVEMLALRAQIEVLESDIDSYKKETANLKNRIIEHRAEEESLQVMLTQERLKSEDLGNQILELHGKLTEQITECQRLEGRVRDLIGRGEELTQMLAGQEQTSEELRREKAAADIETQGLRAQFTETEKNLRDKIENMQAEKVLLESKLRLAQDDRSKLLRDIEGMKREAEATWAAERMENAVMRERIGEVAAEVARLTSVLEGPGSQIEQILAGDKGGHAGIATIGKGHEGSKGSLADRMRALQSRAARLPRAS
jgi:chromosome segregation ATPase